LIFYFILIKLTIINQFLYDYKGSISKVLPGGRWFSFLYGSSLNILNMLVCLVGAALFAKTSVFIFIIVMFSAFSVIISLTMRKSLSIPIPDDNHYLNHTNLLNFTGFKSDTFFNNIYRKINCYTFLI